MTYSVDSIQGGIARLVSFEPIETEIYVSANILPEDCGEGDMLEDAWKKDFSRWRMKQV